MDEKQEILLRLTAQEIYGDELKRSSKGFVRLCPFHEEKKRSFHIFSKDLSFHCYGCNVGGDAFSFIMRKENMEFPDALRILASKAGVELGADRGKYSRLYEINADAMSFYEGNLARNTKAIEYLTKVRCLTRESIGRFHLGCTDGTSLAAHLEAKGYTEAEMLEAGLIVKKNGAPRDFFWKRMIFPISQMGRLRGFGGRTVAESEVKYLNSPETPVFRKGEILYGLNSNAIREKGYAIVVEGYVDVIMWHQHGYPNTVAPLGTSLTEPQVGLLKRFCDTVIPIFDGDNAGKAAAEKTVKLLFDQGMKGYAVELPQGEDPDSYLRKGNPAGPLLDSGLPFGVFLLRHNLKGTRRMLFNAMLGRSSTEIAEYLSFVGSPEELKAFEEMEARTLLEKSLISAPMILKQKGIEIRKHEDCLAVLVNMRFLMKQSIVKDYRQQAEDLLQFILKLKKNRSRVQTPVV